MSKKTQSMPFPDLRAARKSLGLTQAELAAALGVHRMTITKWEGGTHPIPHTVVLVLQHMLRAAKKSAKSAK